MLSAHEPGKEFKADIVVNDKRILLVELPYSHAFFQGQLDKIISPSSPLKSLEIVYMSPPHDYDDYDFERT